MPVLCWTVKPDRCFVLLLTAAFSLAEKTFQDISSSKSIVLRSTVISGSGLVLKIWTIRSVIGPCSSQYADVLIYWAHHQLLIFSIMVKSCDSLSPGVVDPKLPNEEHGQPGRGLAPLLVRSNAGHQASLQRGCCRHAQYPV